MHRRRPPWRCGQRSGVYAGFIHGFMFGDAFDKGLTFKMGQTHVQRFLPELLGYIETGKLQPEAIITHRLSLEKAAEGYKIFNKKQEECRKVILTPGGSDAPLAQLDETTPSRTGHLKPRTFHGATVIFVRSSRASMVCEPVAHGLGRAHFLADPGRCNHVVADQRLHRFGQYRPRHATPRHSRAVCRVLPPRQSVRCWPWRCGRLLRELKTPCSGLRQG